MEKKHDNLEDLFRKSLENYSVPGLRPWEEERKLLEERKRKRHSRRRGYWPFLLAALFLIGTIFYVSIPTPDKESISRTDGGKMNINRIPTEKVTGSQIPANRSVPIPQAGVVGAAKTQTESMKEGINPGNSSSKDDFKAKVSNPIDKTSNRNGRHPDESLGREEDYFEPSLAQQDSVGKLADHAFAGVEATGQRVSFLAPLKFRTANTLALPKPDRVGFTLAADDTTTVRQKDSPSALKPFPVFSLGGLIGIDHLLLPRSDKEDIEFSSTGFMESPSISLAGILQFSPRFLLRSGINLHQFRERLNADVHRTITDIVYAVREKPGDVNYTESDRQVSFNSSYQFDNRYSVLGIPVWAGYILPLGKGDVSLLAGVVANLPLKQTAIVSTDYLVNSQMVNDYTDGMDPDLEGYIHYERYNEYTAEFVPVESKVRPLSLLIDFRAMGRWPLKPNLDLSAEISYAQGVTPFFAGTLPNRPTHTGVRIGILYAFKKSKIPKTRQK